MGSSPLKLGVGLCRLLTYNHFPDYPEPATFPADDRRTLPAVLTCGLVAPLEWRTGVKFRVAELVALSVLRAILADCLRWDIYPQ